MSDLDRYNPSVVDLTSWARRRADYYGRSTDAESVFTGEQMSRIVEVLERFPQGSAADMWTPVDEWTMKPYEPVLLRLFYQYSPDVPAMIEYDVGFWRPDGAGSWQKVRRGRITHCAHINALFTGEQHEIS